MKARLAVEFPILSQTSDSDKVVLLQLRDLMPLDYAYLEIGSFMGGSLVPFLRDPRCKHILSVDVREQIVSDERGIKYDFKGMPVESMLAELAKNGVNTDKLKTFGGSIDQYGIGGVSLYDLVFIDGEHTDVACFRDFVWSMKDVKHDVIVAFHDSTLIHKALQINQEYLRVRGWSFKFFKVHGSEIAMLCFGKYADMVLPFEVEPDMPAFYREAEKVLLSHALQFRIDAERKVTDALVMAAF